MRRTTRTYSYIIFAILTNVLTAALLPPAAPEITPPPRLRIIHNGEKRQIYFSSGEPSAQYSLQTEATDFMGWFYHTDSSVYEDIKCYTGQSYFSSGAYGQCCSNQDDSCGVNTGCLGSASYLPAGSSAGTCGDSSHACATIVVLNSSGDPSPASVIACWTTDWTAWTLTRDIAKEVFTTSSSSSSSSFSSSTPTSTIASSASSPTPTGGSSSHSSSSKAWISGPVLGGVLALTLLAGLGYFLYRRGQKSERRKAAQTPASPYTMVGSTSKQPDHVSGGWEMNTTSTSPPYSQAYSQESPHELADDARLHELPSGHEERWRGGH